MLALACAGSAEPSPGIRPDLSLVPVGRYAFLGGGHADPGLASSEISGFVRIGEDRYAAVGDDSAALHFLRIAVDLATGRVTSAGFEPPVPLSGPGAEPSDREGIAWDPGSGDVWIAGEASPAGPWLARHGLDGTTRAVVDPASAPDLAAFASARPNLGFESLTRRPDDGGYWTANEEALVIDGPAASAGAGSIVRLVSLDPGMRPRAQYAYVTDPPDGPIRSPLPAIGHELSGVAELLALPGGALLALERALAGHKSGMAGFRIRIYRVDLEGATDVSGEAFREGLAGRDWTPAGKSLLLELRFGLLVSNFEAMALGPPLADGSRSVLLFADNQGGDRQSIYALKLTGLESP